jgi:nucleoside-diphosphate-sugar epimerase
LRVAVTGATGFIGSHLVPELAKAGYGVNAAVESGMEDTASEGRIYAVDISTGDGIAAALSGSDVVVHLAARNHVLKEMEKDPLAAYRKINVEGTRNVAQAAAAGGAKLFVHFSSVKAMAEESSEILDENTDCRPITPYGISKLESEEVVRHEAGRSRMRAVIVRLPMVYGPRNKGNLPRMIRWADRGLPFPLFQPDNLRSMVYVENVVAGVLELIKKANEGVSTYILKDAEDYSTRRIYSVICRELRKTPRYVSIPGPVTWLGRALSEDFRKVTESFRVRASKIDKEIRFTPPYSIEEGIARTVQWYRRSVH